MENIKDIAIKKDIKQQVAYCFTLHLLLPLPVNLLFLSDFSTI